MIIGRPALIVASVLAIFANFLPYWVQSDAVVKTAAAVTAAAFEKPGDTPYRLSQVGAVATYRPDGPIRGVALFMSGDGGWNLGVVDMARALQAKGMVVAGISTPAFLKSLEAGHDACINPNYALMALAQDVQHRLALPHYIKPVLVGYSSGATLAYAALAQAPVGLYKGAVSLGFGPDIQGTKPWCLIGKKAAKRIEKPEKGWLLPPSTQLPAQWIMLQGLKDQVVSPAVTRAFVSGIPQAKLVELPKVGHGFSVQSNWMPQFSEAFAPLLNSESGEDNVIYDGDRDIADLPLTPVVGSNAPSTSTMAVLYSGDGGWAGLDRDMAAAFAARGIPVVGVDSLQYFWNTKTPDQAAVDLGRIIGHYGKLWRRPRIILLGYSYGADVLPFIVSKLNAEMRMGIQRMTMLGLDNKADFQFHLSSWLDISGGNALPTVPQIDGLRNISIQCVRGSAEKDSACERISSPFVRKILLPGGHHFDGNAKLIVNTVIGNLNL